MSAQAAACTILWRCYSSPHRTEIYTESSNLVYSLFAESLLHATLAHERTPEHTFTYAKTDHTVLLMVLACVCVCVHASARAMGDGCARDRDGDRSSASTNGGDDIAHENTAKRNISKIVLCVWFGLVLLSVVSTRLASVLHVLCHHTADR